MIYNLFYVLLFSIYQYFIEDFCIYLHQKLSSVISFLQRSLFSFGVWVILASQSNLKNILLFWKTSVVNQYYFCFKTSVEFICETIAMGFPLQGIFGHYFNLFACYRHSGFLFVFDSEFGVDAFQGKCPLHEGNLNYCHKIVHSIPSKCCFSCIP